MTALTARDAHARTCESAAVHALDALRRGVRRERGIVREQRGEALGLVRALKAVAVVCVGDVALRVALQQLQHDGVLVARVAHALHVNDLRALEHAHLARTQRVHLAHLLRCHNHDARLVRAALARTRLCIELV